MINHGREGHFSCKESGKCIPQGWICDGEADCGATDTSDEESSMCRGAVSCLRNEFQCRYDELTKILKLPT